MSTNLLSLIKIRPTKLNLVHPENFKFESLYFVFIVGDRKIQTSSKLMPKDFSLLTWDEYSELNVHGKSYFQVELWEKRFDERDILVGVGFINLSEISSSSSFFVWADLKKISQDIGKILLEGQVIHDLEKSGPEERPAQSSTGRNKTFGAESGLGKSATLGVDPISKSSVDESQIKVLERETKTELPIRSNVGVATEKEKDLPEGFLDKKFGIGGGLAASDSTTESGSLRDKTSSVMTQYSGGIPASCDSYWGSPPVFGSRNRKKIWGAGSQKEEPIPEKLEFFLEEEDDFIKDVEWTVPEEGHRNLIPPSCERAGHFGFRPSYVTSNFPAARRKSSTLSQRKNIPHDLEIVPSWAQSVHVTNIFGDTLGKSARKKKRIFEEKEKYIDREFSESIRESILEVNHPKQIIFLE